MPSQDEPSASIWLRLQRQLPVDTLPADPAFRALKTIPGIAIDLRYASTRNLLGQDLYSPHDCAWLHAQAAAALELASRWLKAHHPLLQLCVLDAVRPHRVQERFWAHVRGTSMQPYFADPALRSIHSFGMAVDVTLLNSLGEELDMGTGFDDTTELAHPVLEDRWLSAGRLLPEQQTCRAILRQAMQQGGWQGIATEWWHFDCGDRQAVRADYRLVV